ncbi:hypothetical protein [Sphingobacterium rhinopitheci]|uniref:hypothetical protein n=1 Tax=Sphingobacterium rhinopitheci TaxID=2781960 RepID=UPI001F526051|nr:hypothetical protein [Sphingobacterium rhinopitheci]MCI0922539.1 hypothetical protein [Sphingobacterium rhinopitheci]
MDLTETTPIESLQNMKLYIELNIEKNLEFEALISRIIELRQNYLDNYSSLERFYNKKNINHTIIELTQIYEHEEDKILTNILCNYYQTNEYTITSMGYDLEQIWVYLFSFDIRNKLGNYINSLQDSVSRICYGN